MHEQIVEQVWNKGKVVPGYDAKTKCGNLRVK